MDPYTESISTGSDVCAVPLRLRRSFSHVCGGSWQKARPAPFVDSSSGWGSYHSFFESGSDSQKGQLKTNSDNEGFGGSGRSNAHPM